MKLQEAIKAYDEGKIKHEDLVLASRIPRAEESIHRLEATG